MAHQLKFMIEQAKIQSEAAKDTAVTQAKIQAENEKREVSLLNCFNMLLRMSLNQNRFVLQL